MGILDRALGDLRNIDKGLTLKVNALRWLFSGVFWGVVMAFVDSHGGIGGIFILPFSMVMAVLMGLFANGLSRMGVPFAGLFDMLMRVMLMGGDWALRLFLNQFGERIGLPYEFGWINFALLLLVGKDGETTDSTEIVRSTVNNILNKQ